MLTAKIREIIPEFHATIVPHCIAAANRRNETPGLRRAEDVSPAILFLVFSPIQDAGFSEPNAAKRVR
jgi:hypothetical protein